MKSESELEKYGVKIIDKSTLVFQCLRCGQFGHQISVQMANCPVSIGIAQKIVQIGVGKVQEIN